MTTLEEEALLIERRRLEAKPNDTFMVTRKQLAQIAAVARNTEVPELVDRIMYPPTTRDVIVRVTTGRSSGDLTPIALLAKILTGYPEAVIVGTTQLPYDTPQMDTEGAL